MGVIYKQCPVCGKQIPGNAMMCMYCHAELLEEPEGPAYEEPVEETTADIDAPYSPLTGVNSLSIPVNFEKNVFNSTHTAITVSLIGMLISVASLFYKTFVLTKGGIENWPGQLVFYRIIAFALIWFLGLNSLHNSVQTISGGRFPLSKARLIGFHLIPIFNLYWICKWPIIFDEFISDKTGEEKDGGIYTGMMIVSIILGKFAAVTVSLLRYSVILMIGLRLYAYADSVYEHLGISPTKKAFYNRNNFKRFLTPAMTVVVFLILIVDILCLFLSYDYDLALKNTNECIAKQDYACAEERATKLIKISPRVAVFHNTRGIVYSRQKKSNLAIKDFDKAVSLDPKFAEAYHNRGLEYIYTGEYELALEDMEHLLELESDSQDALIGRAFARAKLGDFNGALEDYNSLLIINPQNTEAAQLKAALVEQMKQNGLL
ncbi:MAG TPA: tetratricopeptide repeat protein [bacterium]|nr:tetratricopeptide repeat protein [bacterium]